LNYWDGGGKKKAAIGSACPAGVMRLGTGQGFPAWTRLGALIRPTLVYFGKGKIDQNMRFSREILGFPPKTGW
jgi:hypothetical protein